MDSLDFREVIHQLFDENTQTEVPFSQIFGGCIHQAGVFEYKNQRYFIKWNTNTPLMFEKESKGLHLLKSVGAIHIPQVIGYGTATSGVDYLCMEYIQKGRKTHQFWEQFGASLAQLHCHSSHTYGLDHDNYIGSLIQSNTPNDYGVDFFIHERLLVQLHLAHERGLIELEMMRRFDVLISKLVDLMPEDHPALLHGDLWSGNVLPRHDGEPVIFDPAVYFGNRESELAFTRLFGGFDQYFYCAYEEVFPLQAGHEDRVDIFNLYPLLVHANLFGVSYLHEIEQILRRFT